jgi:hypothetical protein
MYSKPRVERFGSLRELTQYGAGPDCDGGAFGVPGGPGDGSSNRCYPDGRS